ncbi:MAG TPA: flagellar basal body rod protein FlgC [Candidatus Sumerlaeota bacterium]|nr:flagellar basal body rod protein FlgC [Candidatus Sumerlaeota bacterium]
MHDLLPIEIAASGMSAQRVRMSVVASNLANANSTRRPDGTGPYLRRMVRFQAQAPQLFQESLTTARQTTEMAQAGPEPEFSTRLAETQLEGVRVAGVEEDPNVRWTYDPTHPDALKSGPKKGYVAYPEISVAAEMTDMITASRGYESNLAVVKNTRDMISQLLDIIKQ